MLMSCQEMIPAATACLGREGCNPTGAIRERHIDLARAQADHTEVWKLTTDSILCTHGHDYTVSCLLARQTSADQLLSFCQLAVGRNLY